MEDRISRSRSGDSGVVDNEPGASSAQDSSSSSDLTDCTSHVVVSNSSLDTELCTFVARQQHSNHDEKTTNDCPEKPEAGNRTDVNKRTAVNVLLSWGVLTEASPRLSMSRPSLVSQPHFVASSSYRSSPRPLHTIYN